MIKKILLTLTVLILMVSLIGCQTVQGVGGDIKWAGEKGAEVLDGE